MAMNTKDEKKRILVVEDDPELIRLHADFLSDSFTVLIESSGAKAIRFLQNDPDIDLALVDVKLPDISGIEVLKKIKKRMPSVPAIVITAFGSEDIAVKAFRCGARDYVKKPFLYGELLRRINFYLSLSATEKTKCRIALTNESEELAENLKHDTKTAANYRMQQALKYIHNNYFTDISLDRVADAASLSKYHFSRLFKETTGVTYQSYLNRVRVEQAGKLLADDALSVTNVAYAVGYTDLTHFERVFKKIVGATPSRYRFQRIAHHNDAPKDH
jgi:YesN/AraC family two-component response regulator